MIYPTRRSKRRTDHGFPPRPLQNCQSAGPGTGSTASAEQGVGLVKEEIGAAFLGTNEATAQVLLGLANLLADDR